LLRFREGSIVSDQTSDLCGNGFVLTESGDGFVTG
jgi:hypothetical protein